MSIMSILSDFFIQAESQNLKYETESCPTLDKLSLRKLSETEVAGILCVLRGVDYDENVEDEFIFLSDEDEELEEWIFSVPDDFIHRIVELKDDQIDNIAERCSKITEEEIHWTTEDFIPVIKGLKLLSQRAIQTGKKMYLWNCL